MSKSFCYLPLRPDLAIECEGGRNLGNCYNESTWLVTSRRKLKREDIDALKDAGFLGCGQEYVVQSQCDGKESPAGIDKVQCVVMVNGKRTDEPPINSYSNQPYPPHDEPYYAYRVIRRVDSSD